MDKYKSDKKRIINVISSILLKPLDDFDKTSQDYIAEWDSLNHAQIIFAIEDEYDFEFTQDQMASIKSANDILNIIRNEN